jgi:hypothetical protein
MIRPITVMSHKVAAVVTPVTSRSRLTMAPAPMNPLRAISGWFAARRCNSWDGPGAIFARIGIAYTANGPRKIFSFQAFLRVRSPGLVNI